MNIRKFCSFLFVLGLLLCSGNFASAATLSLSPSFGSYTAGETFIVNILLDTHDSQGQSVDVDGVDIHYLNFSNMYLEALEVTAGTLFTNTLKNTIHNAYDRTNGKIEFAQASPGSSYNGSGTLATIKFKAENPTIQGIPINITLDHTSGSTTDCNVASNGVDLLSSVGTGVYTISAGDTTGPVITNVSVSNITFDSAVITWTTDEPATSRVDYGTTNAYGSDKGSGNLVTSHNVNLSNLGENTLYHYKVFSIDGSPNQNGSASIDKMFTTKGLPDTTAPAKINNLSSSNITGTSAKLLWTATGDDGNIGMAEEYDIRYSTSLITASNFINADKLLGAPLPQEAGKSEFYVAVELEQGFTYYFALKTADEVPNWSNLSNVEQIDTLPVCDFIYSDWTGCQPNGIQYRTATVLTTYPPECIGGTPILEQECEYVQPTCSSFTYSSWEDCQPDDTQRRTALSSFPAGCTGGNQILSQNCGYIPDPGPTCASWTYSEWGECQADGVKSRNILTKSPSGCDGGNPVLSQSCVYVPESAPTCESFFYYQWSECQSNGTQSRTVKSSSPAGCVEGNLILSQKCEYVSPFEPADTTGPAQPKNFKLFSADKQIMLMWDNPKDNDFVRVKILRKIGSSPTFYNDASATVVYEGSGEEYSDIGLNNTATYYYAIFAYDNTPNYSKKLAISGQPEAGAESMEIPQTEHETTQMSISELKAAILEILTQIAQLQALLVQMKGGEAISDIPAGFEFNNGLKLGMRHQDVVYLKMLLNNEVEHSAWGGSDYFGSKTLSAVKAFQRKYRADISETVGYQINASGYVGLGTRVKLNEILANAEGSE